MPSSLFVHEFHLASVPAPSEPWKQLKLTLSKRGGDGATRELQTVTIGNPFAPVRLQTFTRTLNALPNEGALGAGATATAFAPNCLLLTLARRSGRRAACQEYAVLDLDLAFMLNNCDKINRRCSSTLTLFWSGPHSAAAAAPAAGAPAAQAKIWQTSAFVSVTRVADFDVSKSGSSAAFSLRRASRTYSSAVLQLTDLACRLFHSVARKSQLADPSAAPPAVTAVVSVSPEVPADPAAALWAIAASAGTSFAALEVPGTAAEASQWNVQLAADDPAAAPSAAERPLQSPPVMEIADDHQHLQSGGFEAAGEQLQPLQAPKPEHGRISQISAPCQTQSPAARPLEVSQDVGAVTSLTLSHVIEFGSAAAEVDPAVCLATCAGVRRCKVILGGLAIASIKMAMLGVPAAAMTVKVLGAAHKPSCSCTI